MMIFHAVEQTAFLIFQAYLKGNSENMNIKNYDDYVHEERNRLCTLN